MTQRIVIWGAGKFGQYMYQQLKLNNHVDIVAFVDKGKEMQGKDIDGVRIISPEQLSQDKEEVDAVLVAFMGSLEVYDEFSTYKGIRFGFVNILVLWEKMQLEQDIFMDDNIVWFDDISKPLIRNLETNIVDYCNLNCKGCSHFSNLYKKGERVSFENYCKDLQQIALHLNVGRFNLLGGEALLHERLIEYIEFARKVLPNSEIWVITNGLLLLKQEEEFFDCCIRNRIGIDISEYEPTSRIIDAIRNKLDAYNIRYNIRDNKGDFGKNIDLFGKANPIVAVKQCRESECHFFREGILYKCPFEALGNKFFEHYGSDIRLSGGTNIFDAQLDWKELARSLENDPVSSCIYCGKEVRYAWEVSNNPSMEEWTIN